MNIQFDQKFVDIARHITSESKSLDQWAEIESDDMFQQGDFSGGFDATENEFCFSYENAGKEFWFQLSLNEITKVAKGEITEVEGRPAE